jgi:TRAP-type C4-dicarboxylate transport system substrate-binding protein
MEEITSLREEVKTMIDSADEKTIRMMYAMLEAGAENDWWDELEPDQQQELKSAINEAEYNENIVSLETFKQEFKQWRNELLLENI